MPEKINRSNPENTEKTPKEQNYEKFRSLVDSIHSFGSGMKELKEFDITWKPELIGEAKTSEEDKGQWILKTELLFKPALDDDNLDLIIIKKTSYDGVKTSLIVGADEDGKIMMITSDSLEDKDWNDRSNIGWMLDDDSATKLLEKLWQRMEEVKQNTKEDTLKRINKYGSVDSDSADDFLEENIAQYT